MGWGVSSSRPSSWDLRAWERGSSHTPQTDTETRDPGGAGTASRAPGRLPSSARRPPFLQRGGRALEGDGGGVFRP